MINKISLEKYVRDIPDFPKKGILFKDITTLLKDKNAFSKTVDLLAVKFKEEKIDLVVAVEARGFIFGAAVANKLKAGFIPVRKKGKLPWKTNSMTYDLEYGTDTLEIHNDAINSGDRILIIDDLLATGGTVKAVTDLVQQFKGDIIAIVFVIELLELRGRDKLKGFRVDSLIKY